MKIMSYLRRAEQTVRATAYASAPDKKLNAPSRGIQFCRTEQPGLRMSSMTEVLRKSARLFRSCLSIKYDFFVRVYQSSTTSKQLSTVSANEEKKCLVKSGKVILPILEL